MGNQWGDIYLCVPPTKMLGEVSPRPPYNRRPWCAEQGLRNDRASVRLSRQWRSRAG